MTAVICHQTEAPKRDGNLSTGGTPKVFCSLVQEVGLQPLTAFQVVT
jgi:hypothetical protein